MKQHTEQDKAAILLRVWATEAQGYLYALVNYFGEGQPDWMPSYRIPARTVDLRLGDLEEEGLLMRGSPKKRRVPARKNPPPISPNYFTVHPAGKAWVREFLKERLQQKDFVQTQPLLIECIQCLWEAKATALLHELISTRLETLEAFLKEPPDSGERIWRSKYYVHGLLLGNLRNERYYLEMLRHELESRLGPKRMRDANTNKDKEKEKMKQEVRKADGQ